MTAPSHQKQRCLTQQLLRQQLHYNPQTGVFIWLMNRKRAKIGCVAGCVNPNGYIQIRINGRTYLAHRLAWFYMTGNWPIHDVDHEDLCTGNNVWINLREATSTQNKHNIPRCQANTSGFKGVTWDKNKQAFRARIRVIGRRLSLGLHTTAREAHAAYCAAAVKYHGQFARTV